MWSVLPVASAVSAPTVVSVAPVQSVASVVTVATAVSAPSVVSVVLLSRRRLRPPRSLRLQSLRTSAMPWITWTSKAETIKITNENPLAMVVRGFFT